MKIQLRFKLTDKIYRFCQNSKEYCDLMIRSLFPTVLKLSTIGLFIVEPLRAFYVSIQELNFAMIFRNDL